MAGDWIKMRADLHTHPKVVRMASALKADRLRIVGGLHSAWCLFDVHSVDGFLDGYSPETLDDMIGFPGFARAMMAVGWLEMEAENLVMPRFSEHNGQSAKRRAQDAARKRDVRKKSAPEADNLRTREEKRREDIKDNPLSKGSAHQNEIPHPNVANQILDNRPPAAGPNGLIGKFTMFQGWTPDDDFLLKAAQWGLSLTDVPPQTALAEFITYWQAEGKAFHHAQWEQKFAQSLKHQMSRKKPTGDKRDEKNRRADGYCGPWRGDAYESSIEAMAGQLRAEGRSQQEIYQILAGDDGSVLGSVAGEEWQSAVVTLEPGDYSSH
ncbi:TPA: DnaT-like ssDNA-binding domain-containing protein [Escherichia coli]